jgi:hypothetical protein
MRTHHFGIAVVLSLVAASMLVFVSPSQGATSVVGSLKPEQFVFWDGGQTVNPGAAFSWDLKLQSPGERLRVAISTPARMDTFRLTAVSPSGVSTSTQNTNQYETELFVPKPEQGTWQVEVQPLHTTDTSFRLRAKLEAAVPKPKATRGLLPPNLRMEPPFELGFVAPANPANGAMVDVGNPPLEAFGAHPLSCTVDEMAAGAHRCLRFSFGLGNGGAGNFDVRFDFADDTAGQKKPLMIQCVQKADGSLLAREAGEYKFHETHGHFHYQDVVYHELAKVDPHSGAETIAGKGTKTGYSPADQSFTDWHSFTQAASGTSGAAGDCYPGGSANRIGLSVGWGDTYRWQRPGNFVEFGDNTDGWYIVRTTADPLNHVMESDESDNTSYAYIRVVREQVQLIEQGIGRGPWDPHKTVLEWPARAPVY